jgi:hypothetical protein
MLHILAPMAGMSPSGKGRGLSVSSIACSPCALVLLCNAGHVLSVSQSPEKRGSTRLSFRRSDHCASEPSHDPLCARSCIANLARKARSSSSRRMAIISSVCAIAIMCRGRNNTRTVELMIAAREWRTATAMFCRGPAGGGVRRLCRSGDAGTGATGWWEVEAPPQGMGDTLRSRGSAQVGSPYCRGEGIS